MVFMTLSLGAASATAKPTAVDETKAVLAEAAAKQYCRRHDDCEVYVGWYGCCGTVTGSYPKGRLKAADLQRLGDLVKSLDDPEKGAVCDCADPALEPVCRESRCTIWSEPKDTEAYAVFQNEVFKETSPKAYKRFGEMMRTAEKLMAAKSYKAAKASLTSVPPGKGAMEGWRLLQLGRIQLHTGEELLSIRTFAEVAAFSPKQGISAAYNQLCAWSLSGRADSNNYRGALLGFRDSLRGDRAATERFVKLMATDPDLVRFRAWKEYGKYVPSWLFSDKPMDYD